MAPKPKPFPLLFISALLLLLLLLPNQSVQSRTLNPSVSKFTQLLQTLEGSVKGQTVQGLSQVKNYFRHYGYYPNKVNVVVDNLTDDDDFDETLESAIKLYQKNYGLKVTGSVNAETIREMTIPRCGNPDKVEHEHSGKGKFHMVAHYSFFNGTPRWSKKQLTYSLVGREVVPFNQLRQVCKSAFSKWAKYSNFTFQEVVQGTKSNINISFVSGDHGDGKPFDGPGGKLAHAFAPERGIFHYDADENWSTQPSKNQFDLESLAVHEIGHLLGLDHSMDRNAIMFPTIEDGFIKRDLTQDDIDGIQALYPN